MPVIAVAVLLVTVAAWAPAAPAAKARALNCDPDAIANVDPSNRRGYAIGHTYDTPCSSGWAYTLKYLNRAGSSLATNTGSAGGEYVVAGTEVSCAGAYVHAFFYINVGGVGKSYTSGEDSTCAY